MSRNTAQWMSIADFLARQNYRLVVQAHERKARARSAAAQALACGSAAQGAAQSLPVGNHGEIVLGGAVA